MLQMGEYVFFSASVMSGHQTSFDARRHLPLSEHALKSATVTSLTSMQKGESVTLCGGFSSSSAFGSSEPMKNWPPSMYAMPSGHFGVAAGAIDALADVVVLATELAPLEEAPSSFFPPLSANAAAAPPPIATTAMMAASATGNFLC